MLDKLKSNIHRRYIDTPKLKRERIIALDLLRGTFLLVIFINHLAWAPSLFTFVTGSSHLAASAAEGFFTISGILIGYIYGPRILMNTKQVFIRLLRRAGWLYLLSVFFTILYTIMIAPVGPDYMRTYFDFNSQFSSIHEYLYAVLTLQFIFGWADFLARYAVFMVIAPVALWLIAKKLSWIVVLASTLTWVSAMNNSDIFRSWAIIFLISIIIGYYLPEIEHRSKKAFKKRAVKIGLYVLMASALITYIISTLAVNIFPFLLDGHIALFSDYIKVLMVKTVEINQHLQEGLFSRDTLGIGRLLIGALWFWSLYILFRKFENQIDMKTRGALFLLGTNSLYVYGLSSFIIIMSDILLPVINDRSIFLNSMVVFNLTLILYFFTQKRTQMKRIRYKIIKDKRDSPL